MEEDKLIESKKILTDYMLELNNDIQRAEDWVNTGADEEMYFALQTVLDELERLQKENNDLRAIKETIRYLEEDGEKDDLYYVVGRGSYLANVLENAQDFEKTVHISKLKYLIDSNLEKTENGNYIFASNDCQTIVRHLKRIINNEDYDVTCLHCGKDTPLYCETCYQDLITKNAELQLENKKLKKKHKMICELNVELLENIENFIPKQVLRNRIADLEEVKSKYNFLIGTSYRADGAINTLKKLLNEVN